jgi:hypothetical protein
MKKLHLLVFASVVLVGVGILRLLAADDAPGSDARYEYATIRWAGRENTHIVRRGGEVEFIGHELRKAQKPDRTDDRAYYMNLAMNGLAKEGFEFAGMTNDEIVMKRRIGDR